VTIDHKANAICDLITNDNGFLSSLSADDLASKILMGLSHYAEMRNACILSADSSDWNQITADIESYYLSVIAHKKPMSKRKTN
jgi:hypothetical protein